MATTNGGIFQLTQRENQIQSDHTVQVNVRWGLASGTEVAVKTFLMPSDASLVRIMGGDVLDQPAPQSLIDARDAYLAAWDSYMNTLAAANKLNI